MRLRRIAIHQAVILFFGLLGAPSCLEAEQNQAQTVSGIISAIDTRERQFTIRTGEGGNLAFRVIDQTQLRLNGREVTLDQFKTGVPVTVTYRTSDGRNEATRVAANETTSDDVKRELREAFQAARDYTFQNKDEYLKRLQSVLDNVNTRLDQLKDQVKAAGAEARRQLEPQIEELRKQRDVLQQKMQHVKDSTPAAWEEVKTGVGAALDDLQKAFERAAEKYRK